MSNGNGRATSAAERAAAAALAVEEAAIRQRRADAGAEYEHVTEGLRFSKEFWTHQEAIMRDPMESYGTRFMAWLKRRSWGEFSLYAIREDGWEATQQHAADELGIHKQRISAVVSYYEARGYLYREGKRLYPVIAPTPPPIDQKVLADRTFLEYWKVQHVSDFLALKVALAEVARLYKVRRRARQEWEAKTGTSGTNAPASLLETAGRVPEDPAGSKSLTPFQKDERRRRKRKTQPQNRPVDGGKQSKAQEYAQAREFVRSEVVRMQKAYPNTEFAHPPFDPDTNPEHQNLIELILKRIGTDQDRITGYVVHVVANFKGWGHGEHSRKRAPGAKNGPYSLGLLVNWAEDYARLDPPPRAKGAAD